MYYTRLIPPSLMVHADTRPIAGRLAAARTTLVPVRMVVLGGRQS